MAKIKDLYNDAQGTEQLYPRTHEKAVIDDNGNTLESKLGVITDDVGSLQDAYTALTQSDIVVVADHTAVASPVANTIYREQGSTTYSDWMYYDSAWKKMAEYDNAIDNMPTVESNNLVKSGGVYNSLKYRKEYDSVIDSKHIASDGNLEDNSAQALNVYNVEGDGNVTIFCYLKSGVQIATYAFYSSLETFSENTLLSVGQVTSSGGGVWKTFSVSVPTNSRSLLVTVRKDSTNKSYVESIEIVKLIKSVDDKVAEQAITFTNELNEKQKTSLETGIVSDSKQVKYKDVIGYIGNYRVYTTGIVEDSGYVVTQPITLYPYQTLSTVTSITVNNTAWLFGYDESNDTYYSLGIETQSSGIRTYTNNTNNTIKVVFQHSCASTFVYTTSFHQYEITTNTVVHAEPYNIWENRQVNGVTVGYTTAIGSVIALKAYLSSAYGHMMIPVYKNEIVTVSYLQGAAKRPPISFVDGKTRVLLGGILNTSGNSSIGYTGKYTVPNDSIMILQSNSGVDSAAVYVGGVDKEEYLRRMNKDFEDGNLCYKDFGEANAVIWNKDIVGKLSYDRNTSLHLLHFSDLHADTTTLSSMLNFGKTYKTYIDDIINTGDTVRSNFSDDTWEGVAAVSGIENVLGVIGNHDGATLVDDALIWEGMPKTNVYNRYIKPYVSNWDVVQPSNAEANGYCWYYKDYANVSIRLIVLDSIMSDYTAQTTWLTGVLENARQNNISVVIAQHSPILNGTQMESSYTVAAVASGNFYPNASAVQAVDTFITNGGKFICWLCGHTHFDDMRYLPEHSNQLMICVSTAKNQASLRYRRRNSKSQELFNFISINPTDKFIRIVRIGAGECDNGNTLDMVGVDYQNHKVFK